MYIVLNILLYTTVLYIQGGIHDDEEGTPVQSRQTLQNLTEHVEEKKYVPNFYSSH